MPRSLSQSFVTLDKSSENDPFPVFRFDVRIEGLDIDIIGVFTECTLPNIEWDLEEVKEGGQNTYVHQLMGRRKAAKVTLKNGLTKQWSLLKWYSDLMLEKIYTHTVTITLRDTTLAPVMHWNLERAYPVKITGPALKSGDNAIAIETLELACGNVTMGRGAGSSAG